MNGIIYKATNTVNGKEYIGLTTTTLRQRIFSHKCAARKKNPIALFSKALKKYGIENFKFIQVDSFSSLDEGNEKEIRWIAHYHTYVDDPLCNGYNLTTGGNSFVMAKESRMNQARKMKEAWANPDWRQKQLKAMNDKFTSDEYRNNMADVIRHRWANPQFRDKMESVEIKKKSRINQIAAWADPIKRKSRIESLTKAQRGMTQEEKDHKRQAIRDTLSNRTEEQKELHRVRHKNALNTDECRKKRSESQKTFRQKLENDPDLKRNYWIKVYGKEPE